MPDCYGYIRVSHEEQVRHGFSLEAQETRVRDYWERYLKPDGIAWGGLHVDAAVSAFKIPFAKRAAGGKLLLAMQPGDHVVIAKLDRGFRNTMDAHNTLPIFKAKRVGLLFLDLNIDITTASGELIFSIMVATAQWESRARSERIKTAFTSAKKRGFHISPKRPPGKTIVGKKGAYRLEDDPLERAVMGEIVKLRDEQRLSWEQISVSIESRLAAYEQRPFTTSAFCTRTWSASRCRSSYKSEKRYRKEEARLATPAPK